MKPSSAYTEVRDIVYYPTNDSDEDKYSLDLFIPSQTPLCMDGVASHVKNTTAKLYPWVNSSQSEFLEKCIPVSQTQVLPPIVLFVHGGGWQRGGRLAWINFLRTPNLLMALVTWCMDLYRNVGRALASRGVACAVISYPLVDLPMPWTLPDIFISYFCSLLVSTPICLLVVLLSSPLELLSGFNISFSTYLTFNNICVSSAVLFSSKWNHRGPYISGCILVAVICILTVMTDGFQNALCLFSLLVYLGLLAIFRRTKSVSHKQQIQAVTRSIKWIKHFGRNRNYFDPTSLFLMGHSAGGHLVALLTLDKDYLRDSECLPTDIKGVMCISGVYDLLTLSSSPVGRRLYLQPIFGDHSSGWEKASPVRTLEGADDTSRNPPFLIVNAQFDGFFKTEGDNFCNELRKKNFIVSRQSLKWTTHFTIMAHFTTATNSEISKLCVEFIKTNSR